MTSSRAGRASQPNRLPRGGLIERGRPVAFRFDGGTYGGFAGDTLASALLAAGVRIVARSFKYHRPRGILSAGAEEPNALLTVGAGARREPNTRATTVELFEGLEARSQNRWPTLSLDIGALGSLLSPLFASGFYYKTFMWPAAFWERVYEPAIRRAAGLGRASLEADPDRYEKVHAFCDVLVIGSGPAGLAAALAAGRAGARVLLCEEDFLLGGRLNSDRLEIDGMSGSAWAQRAERELEALPEVRILRRTCVFGAYDGGIFGALERAADHLAVPTQPRQRYWKIVARRAVLAAGAIERPLVFPGNDRPGVLLASAVRAYVNRFAVAPGRRVVLFTSTDDGWKTASHLVAAGIGMEAIVDSRGEVAPGVIAGVGRCGARTLLGAHVTDTHGARALRGVTVRDRDGRSVRLEADLLAVSGGWNPNLALATHLGERPLWNGELSAFVPGAMRAGVSVAGAAAGTFSLPAILRAGALAGVRAAESLGYSPGAPLSFQAGEENTGIGAIQSLPRTRGKAFVDFQHDVTQEDVKLAAREGFRSVEHLKRYTTLGMGTDQGKTSSVNGLAMLAALTGRDIPEVGSTAFRPPCTPIAIGALAGPHRGRHFRPTRLTPGHAWARERGAVFVETGEWLRARWFPLPGERSWLESVSREARAVRSHAGVCDVSTLGKIDVQGPDAGAFLDRIYINTFSALAVGKVRYGLMLREDGFVLDDGTGARFAEDRYLVSTTTMNAERVLQHLEFASQVLWPELDVQITSVTEQWAQYAIAGPRAREVLERLLGPALDLSNAAFPHLGCAEFIWQGIGMRLFRISFSGELGYELAAPARFGDALLRAILKSGATCGIVPYGMEALNVLRIEKGHVTGNEINGTTTAEDLGFGRMMSGAKDFIGRVLAAREGLTDPARAALVGLKPVKASERLCAGAHLLARGAAPSLQNDQGYVTSVGYSPTLESWIGLALLASGRKRLGERLRAWDALRGNTTEVEVTLPVFHDPEGRRLRA
jgi:heterotetrameric sarcosine oxidase alpha subunit